MIVLNLILTIIIVEAITEIITDSEICRPIREFFFNRKKYIIFKFIHNLLDCGYCTSVWVGWFVAYFTISNNFFGWFFTGILIHRLSNILHEMISLIHNADYYIMKGQGD